MSRLYEERLTYFPTAIVAKSCLIARAVEVKEVVVERKDLRLSRSSNYRNVGRAGTNSLRFTASFIT